MCIRDRSCDVYFYNLAERIGIERIAKTARKFGIGITPNLPLSGISKGLIPSKSWKKNTILNSYWVKFRRKLV